MTDTGNHGEGAAERPDVALGVKVFKRVEKTRRLLDSVPSDLVSRVIVADDGETTDRKERLYSMDFEFDVTVLDLDYDAGVGYGRKRIVEELEEAFLVVVDPDHVCPPDLDTLIDQLRADDSIGGVAGSVVEPGQSSIELRGADLAEVGKRLIQDGNVSKDLESVAGDLFVEFDFIPNVAAFRRECVEECSWDPNYIIGRAHLDFYVGHWKRTDWRFGVCPNVCFQHFPGGSNEYMSERENEEKLRSSVEYFAEKWDYEFFERGQHFCGLSPRDNAFDELGLTTEDGQLASDVTIEFTAEDDSIRLRVVSPAGETVADAERSLHSNTLDRNVTPIVYF